MQLTLRQVADMFGVSENTVTGWVKDDNLPAHDVAAQYGFNRVELLEWAVTNRRTFSPSIFREIHGHHPTQATLAEAVERGGVAAGLTGSDRTTVLRAAVDGLPVLPSFDRDVLLDLLTYREQSGGTAIGHGIAIPHPRSPMIVPGGESIVQVCYLRDGLDYHVGDGALVDTLILMICPTVHEHLQLLARLACVLNSESFRTILKSRPDKAHLVSALRAEEVAFGGGVHSK